MNTKKTGNCAHPRVCPDGCQMCLDCQFCMCGEVAKVHRPAQIWRTLRRVSALARTGQIEAAMQQARAVPHWALRIWDVHTAVKLGCVRGLTWILGIKG